MLQKGYQKDLTILVEGYKHMYKGKRDIFAEVRVGGVNSHALATGVDNRRR